MKKKHVILLIAILILIFINPLSWFKDDSKEEGISKNQTLEQPYKKKKYLVNESNILASENCTVYFVHITSQPAH